MHAVRVLDLMTGKKFTPVPGVKTNQWPNYKLSICQNFSRTGVGIPNVGNEFRLNCSK
jgi:hypothetical protein